MHSFVTPFVVVSSGKRRTEAGAEGRHQQAEGEGGHQSQGQRCFRLLSIVAKVEEKEETVL